MLRSAKRARSVASADATAVVPARDLPDEGGAEATELDWLVEQAETTRLLRRTVPIVSVVVPVMAVVALAMVQLVPSSVARYPAIAGCMFLMHQPFGYLLGRRNSMQQARSDRLVGRLIRAQHTQVHRQEFGRRLGNALEMAEGEAEVVEVVQRSFRSILPDAPVELLLADNSQAHLLRVATASPTGVAPGCGVESPQGCPAARRAQTQVFTDSGDLDACPKLRNRAGGAISAMCVPVSVMGRTVGVIHATGEVNASVTADKVTDLATLANLAGARISLLRVMAETQLQASTDNLTGLLNRRAFEQKVSVARQSATVLSVAMIDLDHFKQLNDTYGHDSGDRALRLFSQTVTDSVRAYDLLCRHGGEEFVLAFPGCTATKASEVLQAVRVRLAAAVTVAGLPAFTASFGVVQAADKEALPSLIKRADAALFEAKRDGRDRVVVHDANGTAMAPALDPAGPRGLDGRHRTGSEDSTSMVTLSG